MNDRDEILIQRCVDNEATPEERHELMERLDDADDGWKLLACSFLEDQLFSTATVQETLRPGSLPAPEPAKPQRHWFAHPAVSVALSACIAFMAGLLIRGQSNGPEVPVADQSTDPGNTAGASSAGSSGGGELAAASVVGNNGEYRVQLMENGVPAGELPVFSSEDYARRSREYWQELERLGGRTNDRQRRIIKLQAADGSVYIIPVEEFFIPGFQ